VFSYFSATYNTTYLLNTDVVDQGAAESYCRLQGGHLASWSDTSEQAEVETYFIDQSQLLIPQLDAYWLGAAASMNGTDNKWPNFRWGRTGGKGLQRRCTAAACCRGRAGLQLTVPAGASPAALCAGGWTSRSRAPAWLATGATPAR
jgi:hypothetical protein